MATYDSHVDGNQQFSIIGVIGTNGTADVAGTAKTLPIGVNPDNGGLYVSPITLDPLAQTNPSLVLTYTGSNLTTIQKVISGVTYTKTLGYDGSGNLTSVSVWS